MPSKSSDGAHESVGQPNGSADLDQVCWSVPSLPCSPVEYGPAARKKLLGKENFVVIRLWCWEVKPSVSIPVWKQPISNFLGDNDNSPHSNSYSKFHQIKLSCYLTYFSWEQHKKDFTGEDTELQGSRNLGRIKPQLNNGKNGSQILTVIPLSEITPSFVHLTNSCPSVFDLAEKLWFLEIKCTNKDNFYKSKQAKKKKKDKKKRDD